MRVTKAFPNFRRITHMVAHESLVDKLNVTADGKGQVGHAGSALLAGVADRGRTHAGVVGGDGAHAPAALGARTGGGVARSGGDARRRR
jgi:hypothetical protein